MCVCLCVGHKESAKRQIDSVWSLCVYIDGLVEVEEGIAERHVGEIFEFAYNFLLDIIPLLALKGMFFSNISCYKTVTMQLGSV